MTRPFVYKPVSYAIIALGTLCVILSFLVSGWALHQRFQEANKRRADQAAINQRLNDLIVSRQKVWHDVLCYAEKQVNTSPGVTDAQRRAAIRFYNHSLELAGAKPCSPLEVA